MPTVSPLKMSRVESPTVSSTLPIVLAVGADDLPALLDQVPGDRVGHQTARPPTYQTGPCVETGFVSESARRTRKLAGDPLVVEALEAAVRHLGRGAVAEAARDAEAVARRLP